MADLFTLERYPWAADPGTLRRERYPDWLWTEITGIKAEPDARERRRVSATIATRQRALARSWR